MDRIRDAIMMLLRHPAVVTFEHLGIVARADDCAKHGDIVSAITLMRLLADTLPANEQEAYRKVLDAPRQQELTNVS